MLTQRLAFTGSGRATRRRALYLRARRLFAVAVPRHARPATSSTTLLDRINCDFLRRAAMTTPKSGSLWYEAHRATGRAEARKVDTRSYFQACAALPCNVFG